MPPTASPFAPHPAVVISIVSHGHGALVLRLLGQLVGLPAGSVAGVVLTLNAAESNDAAQIDAAMADKALAKKLNLQVLRNAHPRGFGANHNQAFKAAGQCFGAANTGVFCVMNPDIELMNGSVGALLGAPSNGPQGKKLHELAKTEVKTNVVTALVAALGQAGVGLAYPVQVDATDQWLDFERALATPHAIFLRRLGFGFGFELGGVGGLPGQRLPDWVSGAVMAFRADVFAKLGGFDERYFMYCEDVDICLRLQLAGYTLKKANVSVVHHAQRRTLTNFKHLAWHVRSLLRLWRSSAYHAYIESSATKKSER